MPTKDRTRRAVEGAAVRGLQVLERFKDVVPLGPTQVKMSSRELKANLQKAKGDEMAKLIETLGAERILELLRGT
jgi:hypothetical protein